MHAFEIETEIAPHREIHLKLPPEVKANKAREAVLSVDTLETPEAQPKPIRLGLFRGQIQTSDDFDAPLPDDCWLGGIHDR